MNQQAADLHKPVLVDACVELLAPALQQPGSIFIDCTLGMGGHTEAVLEECPNAWAFGIDRDPQALELASQRLAKFGERFTAIHAEYDQVDQVAKTAREAVAANLDNSGSAGNIAGTPAQAPAKVDAILFDLGVSSLQLDESERGFAYAQDAPLDMRMDQSTGPTAADFLATADPREIARVLREYGEEKFASRIAAKIDEARREKPLTRTSELVEIVRDAIPAPARRKGGNPAKRTFQALRIAVNDELRILRRAIPRALNSLRVGGRLVVESYQSLEDRIVKTELRQVTTVQTLPGLPVVPAGETAKARDLTRGAIQADDMELAHNPRAASVRLRAVEVLEPIDLKNPPESDRSELQGANRMRKNQVKKRRNK